MHRARAAAVLVALLSLTLPRTAPGAPPETLGQARRLLSQENARAAVALLEEALVSALTQRGEILSLLRQAYAAAARQSEVMGKVHDAEMFRDNLEILNRKLKSAPPEAQDGGVPKPEPKPVTVDLPSERPVRSASLPTAADAASVVEPPKPEALDLRSAIEVADAAFVTKHYDEAGRIYATLARQGRLPKTRRDHWAYCRCFEVVRRINARPTPREWESIDAEIREILVLSPNNWYGEYLRNRATQRTPGRHASLTAKTDKVVVRASAPEDPGVTPALAVETHPASPPAPKSPVPVQAPRAAPAPPASSPAQGASIETTGKWQVHDTANFRILHDNPELARRVADTAETARESLVKRWMGEGARNAWTPRCDIYLYPNAKVFSRMTGQPEESPGFSTMGMNSGRVIARRINLRADHSNLVPAILPHEITHVVLADLFPHQQIPRWADEGMAVLAEPTTEQRLRAADLDKPLARGQLFKVEDLMVMDYPDGKFWGLYYAQSVSLTRFLVEQGSPAQFIQFVQGSQRDGPEAELRRVYKIAGFSDLQKRWLDYARSRSAAMTAAKPAETPDTANR